MTPPGTETFGVALEGEQRLSGSIVSEGQIGHPRDGAEFEYLAPRPAVTLVVSIDRDPFARLGAHDAVASVTHSAPGSFPAFRDGEARRRLVASWLHWLRSAVLDPGWVKDPGRAALLDASVASALIAAVDWGKGSRGAGPRSSQVARQLDELLRSRLDRAVTMQEAAQVLAAPPRTLHASFRARYGMSPMAYLRALRLDAARQDLPRAGPGTRIADVAVRWCCFHLGRFSVAYRRAFGESPSETLSRARRARTAKRSRLSPGRATRRADAGGEHDRARADRRLETRRRRGGNRRKSPCGGGRAGNRNHCDVE